MSSPQNPPEAPPQALTDAAAVWRAALEWQLELGADDPVGETPFDWTTAPTTRSPARAPASAPQKRRTPSPAAPASDPAADARALAAAATDIDGLRAALQTFEGSTLKAGARSTVFADGHPSADLMVIGEAPGRDEDRMGLPFVGRSGQLLDRMLAAIGRARAEADPARGAYITNVIPYRPLENRTPDDQEVRALLPFVERHIALARPRAILCVGNVPAKHLMSAGTGITRYRGTWTNIVIDGATIPALATFHPAYLLRSPDQKRLAWRDLLSLEARLAAAPSGDADP